MKILINILYFTVHFYCIFTYDNKQEYICKEQKLSTEEFVTGVEIDDFPPNTRVKRTDDKFRIHLEYLKSFENDPDAELLKKQFLDPAIDVLRNAVKPKNPVVGILRVDRQCISKQRSLLGDGKIVCTQGCAKITFCRDAPVPEKYLKKCKLKDSSNNYYEEGTEGEGITNTDLVVLVIRKPCDVGTLAWALSCFSENTLDRPIFGLMNICSTAIKVNEDIESGVNTVVHELIHVLGFSSSRYAFFRDRDGNPLVPRSAFNTPNLGITNGEYNFNDKIAKEVQRNRQSRQISYTKTVYALTLPTVVKEAQDFFNCPKMTEVDLEESGDSGNTMSHFDEYVLHDEIMSPQQFKVENLTRLTLAFLYDTGWYDVNYCAAKPMRYGYKAGCTLPLEGCYKYMKEQREKGQSISPFCDINFDVSPRLVKCTPDNKYIKFCQLSPVKDTKYDYIDSMQGGYSLMMEYCPINLTESCETKGIGLPMVYPIYYGIDSRCSANNIKPGGAQLGGVTCLKTTCESDKYTLQTTYGTVTCVDSKDVTIKSATFKCIPQTSMCPTTDGTICAITNGTAANPNNNKPTIFNEPIKKTTYKNQLPYIPITRRPIQEKIQSRKTSNNIQISLFNLLFYFIVLICLLI